MTPALFCALTNIGTNKMENLTALLVCTLVIFLYVDTSTAAVSEVNCTTVARQTTCGAIENAVCEVTKCKCLDGTTEVNDKCILAAGGDCSNLACNTENAACINDKCTCNTGFVQVNGVCEKELTDIDCSSGGDEVCPDNAICKDNDKCECDVDFELQGNQCAGAGSTKAVIWMVVSSLFIILVNKLLI